MLRKLCLLQGFLDQRYDLAHMIARRELGHHPAVFSVQRYLAIQCVSQQALLTVIQRNTRFITRRFYSKD